MQKNILIVDDGSDDGSFEKLKLISEAKKNFRLVRLTRNFGQQSAVFAGFRISQGEIVVQLDSDLQNPPEEIPKLLSALTDDIDLVTTIHKKRQDDLKEGNNPTNTDWKVESGIPLFKKKRSSKLAKLLEAR